MLIVQLGVAMGGMLTCQLLERACMLVLCSCHHVHNLHRCLNHHLSTPPLAGNTHGTVGGKSLSAEAKSFDVLNSAGSILFAYSFSMILVEIQVRGGLLVVVLGCASIILSDLSPLFPCRAPGHCQTQQERERDCADAQGSLHFPCHHDGFLFGAFVPRMKGKRAENLPVSQGISSSVGLGAAHPFLDVCSPIPLMHLFE